MSVSLECQKGDEFVCIGEFHATPDGPDGRPIPFVWDKAREFHVGDRLKFVSSSVGIGTIHIKFIAPDKKTYEAVESYFLTTEEWNRLHDYFKEGNM